MPERPVADNTPGEERYFSQQFGGDLVRAPAMVMALGICTLFAVRYQVEQWWGPRQALVVVSWAASLVFGLAAYLFYLFLGQARRDVRVLWGYSAQHFAIGTWVASLSVLSRLVRPEAQRLADTLACGAAACWVLYMSWFVLAAARPDVRRAADGRVFLTTVATQSMVIGLADVRFFASARWLRGLLVLNAAGVLLYVVSFYWVWIRRGVQQQLAHWGAHNNITHGALSISVLAAATLASHAPQWAPVLQRVCEVLWVVAVLLLTAIASAELYLLWSRTARLVAFNVANYARNFTYGMFFAATLVAGRQFPASPIWRTARGPVLWLLSAVVLAVNVFEVSRHLRSWRTRRVPTGECCPS